MDRSFRAGALGFPEKMPLRMVNPVGIMGQSSRLSSSKRIFRSSP